MLLVIILSLLKVLSCVRCEETTVRGYEGGNAVIDCPHKSGDDSKPKYLQRKESDQEVVIKSNGSAEWTHRGRFSLQDKRNSSIFTVTIHNLTLKDAGSYWCGSDRSFVRDNYIIVMLKVDKVPGHQSPESKPVIPKVTTRSTTTFTSSKSVTTRITNTRKPAEVTVTKPEPSPTPPTSGVLVYTGAGLAVVVFVLILSAVIFYTQTPRGSKSSSGSGNCTYFLFCQTAPPSGIRTNANQCQNTQQVQCDYAEVTISSGNSASASSHVTPTTDSSAIYANVQRPSNQNTDCVDYSLIRFDQDEESLQYAAVRFTEAPAGGDKQGSTQRHERDGAVK